MTGEAICEVLDAMRRDGAELEALAKKAVELLHESEVNFHWTGIYELFEEKQLRLGPFVGAPTDHVFIGVGDGVCGSAVAEARNKNIADVTKESNYLACSTQTKSELVVLIRKKDKIFAQIDIDSHEVGAFTDELERRVQLVADWLADRYDED